MNGKEQMRNYSQCDGHSINYGTAPYGTVYPQPSQKYNQGLNQYQNQDLLSCSQQFDNQYDYYQQQQDMCQDNDSFLSSNIIPQNPPSQEEICDIYMNQKPFLVNSEKNQQIEDQSTMILPSNNQDIFYDIEEPESNLNYEQEQINQQDYMMNPYYQVPNINQNFNYANMKNYKNGNFQQNQYEPVFNNKPIINQKQNDIYQNIQQNPNQYTDNSNQRNQILNKNINQNQNLNQIQYLNQNENNINQMNQTNHSTQNYQNPQYQQNNKHVQLQNENQPIQNESQLQNASFQPINNTQQNYQSIPNQNNSPQYQQLNQNGEFYQKYDQNIAHNNNNMIPPYNVQLIVKNPENEQKQEIDNSIINQNQRFNESQKVNQQQLSESQQCFSSKNNDYSQDQLSNKNFSSQNIASEYGQYDNEINETDQNEQYSSKSHTIQSSYDNSLGTYPKQNQRRKQRGHEQNQSAPLESKKAIKKYKPKKKYKQSRQKNVFKNFGNALMNCIQNNFVIRDFIEKCLGNDANAIDTFHNQFLKETLHHLKNKEDFLQGWSIQDQLDNEQVVLFKSVFKEVSLRFFNEYAAKYVNESDKLKNKDIHIKAIPIFIRGIQNVNELYKFKLS